MLDNVALTSILTTILTVIIAGVGGVIAITNPETLGFQDYATTVGIGVGASAGGLGFLGMARTQSGKGVRR